MHAGARLNGQGSICNTSYRFICYTARGIVSLERLEDEALGCTPEGAVTK